MPNEGIPNHALYLKKAATTPTNAAAGASVDGTAGITLTELGFDYRNDSWCGAGAPRFNVYTTAGTYFFFGCRYGVHTPVPGEPNWTRVRFGTEAMRRARPPTSLSVDRVPRPRSGESRFRRPC